MSIDWSAKLQSPPLSIGEVLNASTSLLRDLAKLNDLVIVALSDAGAIRDTVAPSDADIPRVTRLQPPEHCRFQLVGTAFAVDLVAVRVDGMADDEDAGDWCVVDAGAHRSGPSYLLALATVLAIASMSGTWVVDEVDLVGLGRKFSPLDALEYLALTDIPPSLAAAAERILSRTNLEP